jgi:hypothetical protein
MIEIPIVALVLFLLSAGGLGAFVGAHPRSAQRALDRATPTWEVRIVSDGVHYDHLGPGLGHSVVVLVRKVRRAKGKVRVLEKIEIARVRAEDDAPERLMAAVDRANAMIAAFTMTGAA